MNYIIDKIRKIKEYVSPQFANFNAEVEPHKLIEKNKWLHR